MKVWMIILILVGSFVVKAVWDNKVNQDLRIAELSLQITKLQTDLESLKMECVK